MSLLSNFIAVIVATTTAFSSGVMDADVTLPPDRIQTQARANVENAATIAQGANMASGIAVVDRADDNNVITNGDLAHRPYQLESLGRLPILLYAVRVGDIADGDDSDAVSMMQGYSGEAANRMWEEYGEGDIIRDLSARYNLQETHVGDSWRTTESTALDVARLIRRFLDDDSVTRDEKEWVVTLLRNTSLNVSGENFSWGLPAAAGIVDGNTRSNNDELAWAQGWSSSGSTPMVRSSAGIVGQDMRFVVVIMGQVPSETSNPDADRIISETATALLNDPGIYSDDDYKKNEIESFQDAQERRYGDFVTNR